MASSVDKEIYRSQLEIIRQKGYATSIEEREQGTSAVATPIFNRQGQVLAALSVSGPTSRLTFEKMDEIAPMIKDAAEGWERW